MYSFHRSKMPNSFANSSQLPPAQISLSYYYYRLITAYHEGICTLFFFISETFDPAQSAVEQIQSDTSNG